MDSALMNQSVAVSTSSTLVSLVILNWNEGERIQKCLEHVFQQTYDNLEVIIIDNGSSDGSTDKAVERWGDGLIIIRNSQNVGFPQGMNQGIAQSRGKYLLLLNADLYLESSFIGRTVATMEQLTENHLGMMGGIVHVYRDDRNTDEIDFAGLLLTPFLSLVSSPNVADPQFVLGPAGSAMFVSRAMLEDTRLPGGDYLDSTYFLYGEDVELFLRSQIMGWKCLFQPIVVGWHVGGASVGEKGLKNVSDFFQIHTIKNRFATIITCYPLSLCLRTLPWNLLGDMGIVGLSLVTGRWRLLRNWCRAVGITIRALPRLLRKRRWIASRSQVSGAYLRSLYIKRSIWETLLDLVQNAR
jgi:GT2 family glycosyltransferase